MLKKCDICGVDYKSISYFKNKSLNTIVCEDCLLNIEGLVDTETVTEYYLNGEYIGNDYDIDEVYNSICNNTDYEEIVE